MPSPSFCKQCGEQFYLTHSCGKETDGSPLPSVYDKIERLNRRVNWYAGKLREARACIEDSFDGLLMEETYYGPARKLLEEIEKGPNEV